MSDDAITFQVREFDVHSIYPRNISDPSETGSKVVIIGASSQGKTTMLLDLCYKKKHQFPVACIVNGNEESNSTYEKSFPKALIHTELTDELIENVRQRQNIAKKHLVNPWLLFIKDDCIDSPSHFHRAVVQTFYKRARHWNTLSILGMHYAMEIPTAVRMNIDYCFIFREPSPKVRRILWENFAGIIPTFQLFCKIMDEITGDYNALVIANRMSSNDPQDCVFWYKAPKDPIPKDFKFCCEDAWLFNDQRLYVGDDEDSDRD